MIHNNMVVQLVPLQLVAVCSCTADTSPIPVARTVLRHAAGAVIVIWPSIQAECLCVHVFMCFMCLPLYPLKSLTMFIQQYEHTVCSYVHMSICSLVNAQFSEVALRMTCMACWVPGFPLPWSTHYTEASGTRDIHLGHLLPGAIPATYCHSHNPLTQETQARNSG